MRWGPGTLYRVHIEVIDGVELPTLLMIPHAAEHTPAPAVICQHGYAGSPEWVFGFGTENQQNYLNAVGHRLASEGYVVIAPQIVCSPPGCGLGPRAAGSPGAAGGREPAGL